MKELDEELWKLGVMAKTEHNEAAPAQHELAPIFTTTNIAADHNQLTMERMQRIARKHGMVCLLHEKPFAGVNGSGKHNNWSISTNTGVNLFEPGETPAENAQFLLFLCAVIQAVDDYQDMMRLCVASAGNDHRLGAAEAPPAIVSIFLGEELQAILDAIENDTPYGSREKELFKVGVHVMPKFPKDTTDRNRTSPFAFTGNKFEFRMLGASQSISGPNVVLNTAVAESLRQYADRLEGAEDFESALHELICEVIHKHRRIIFNGNGYDDAWIREAESRGLSNYPSTPDCAPCYIAEKNVELFTRHKVYTETEMHARYEIKHRRGTQRPRRLCLHPRPRAGKCHGGRQGAARDPRRRPLLPGSGLPRHAEPALGGGRHGAALRRQVLALPQLRRDPLQREVKTAAAYRRPRRVILSEAKDLKRPALYRRQRLSFFVAAAT